MSPAVFITIIALMIPELKRVVSVIFVVLNKNKVNLYSYNIFDMHSYFKSNENCIRVYFAHLCW